MELSKSNSKGAFVISLDFELYWGVLDKYELKSRKEYFINTREKAIPAMLSLFQTYGIEVTWATVGMLFCDGMDELEANLPNNKPNYKAQKLSAYHYLQNHTLGKSEEEDPYHFAPSIIKEIAKVPGQEIATHTFSHYYCLEAGQEPSDFYDDLIAAKKAGGNLGFELKSLVFPRNQYNESYLQICEQAGIEVVRGNENAWIWKPDSRSSEGNRKRIVRLADSYFNLYGHNAYTQSDLINGAILNAKASRFLRPYQSKLKSLETQKIDRICKDIDFAARQNACYHLWWHPHNFGYHTQQNLDNLKRILDCFALNRESFGMQSFNMANLKGWMQKAQPNV
jgi:peptidoglycan/xylan/chitin deacetylase (PgdA/CDA1 family)